jgi:hypothetical protein
VAPSWSWASVEGPVLLGVQSKYAVICATVLDLRVELVTLHPFGQVKGGWRRIRARMCVATRDEEVYEDMARPFSLTNHGLPPQIITSHVIPEEPRPRSGDLDVSTIGFVLVDDHTSTGGHKVFFLPIRSSGGDTDGLLLELLPMGEYIRVGILSVYNDFCERIFECLEERIVTIL